MIIYKLFEDEKINYRKPHSVLYFVFTLMKINSEINEYSQKNVNGFRRSTPII